MAEDTARYFQPAERAGDRVYLPATMNVPSKWADLERVCFQAEDDVVEFFTRDLYRSGSSYRVLTSSGATRLMGDFEEYELLADGRRAVFLRGYKVSAADVTDAAFLKAMKRTVALVVEWRKLSEAKDPQADMESADGKTVTKAKNHQQPFPPGWRRWVKTFITLDPPGMLRI